MVRLTDVAMNSPSRMMMTNTRARIRRYEVSNCPCAVCGSTPYACSTCGAITSTLLFFFLLLLLCTNTRPCRRAMNVCLGQGLLSLDTLSPHMTCQAQRRRQYGQAVHQFLLNQQLALLIIPTGLLMTLCLGHCKIATLILKHHKQNA